jgi:hypothetical protein
MVTAPTCVVAAPAATASRPVRRALWRIGEWPEPPPEVLALAAQLDRLRHVRRPPRWWIACDDMTAWRLARERRGKAQEAPLVLVRRRAVGSR